MTETRNMTGIGNDIPESHNPHISELRTPRAVAEWLGTYGPEEPDAELNLDGHYSNLLCDGIAELMAAIATLERENAELRACANIDEALGALEDDPDRQTPGQRTWHLYFDGLYNEMPY